MIGQHLSHYRIVSKLGGGGMGVVYRAEDLRLGRSVALKVLPENLASNPRALERFNREARAASSLNHPNICVIHEFGDDKGRCFLVMELMDGETLKRRISGTPLDPRDVIRIGAQVADGLAAAHQKRILHRDIKPANIFVTTHGEVKILDFGLATETIRRPVDADDPTGSLPDALTDPGAIVGTLPYMSPEQANAEALDERTDLYSLGVVLYEMATGILPVRGRNAVEVLDAIMHREPLPVAQLNPRVPVRLQEIIAKAIEKEPRLRYQSASDLYADLQRLRDHPPAAPAASSRRKARQMFWVSALLVGLGGAAWLGGTRKTANRLPSTKELSSIAVLPFVDMSPSGDQEYFSDGLSEELLNVLAKIPELRVAARTSSFLYKGRAADVSNIGQQLNVATVLEGSVRTSGNRVRITAQLINVADGFHLWSETYDRELDDVLAVQDDIARAVAEALRVRLTESRRSRAGPNAPSGDAYTLYLQAKYLAARRTREDLERSISYYEEVLLLSPAYAPAYVALADARIAQAGRSYIPVDEGFRKAREELQKALALDPELADAHASLGVLQRNYDWDWSEAEKSCRRALELEPANPRSIRCAGRVTATFARFREAAALFERANRADPLNAAGYWVLGGMQVCAGQLDIAERTFRKALELNPALPGGHFGVGLVYLLQSRPEPALAEMEREPESIWRRQGLALAYHAVGRRAEADAALAALLEKDKAASIIQIASVYAFRGDSDQALAWLEKAYANRDPGISDINGYPLFKSIASDPRYKALLARLHL